MAGKLTPKQAMFYGEYIKDFNGTRAARAIGVPEKSAAVFSARMLRNDKVAGAIEAWRARQQERLEVSAERVINELVKLATFDPGNLYDKAGNRIPVHELDDFTRAAVAAVEDETTETIEDKRTTVRRYQRVKMAEKGQNLERLGRYFKLFTDRVEHDGKIAVDSFTDEERAARIAAILNAAKSRKHAA
jgi:phage terminase small subunit